MARRIAGPAWRRWHCGTDAADALAASAARGARHAVPAGRHRLDGAASPDASAGLVHPDDRLDAGVARPARADQRPPARSLVVAGAAGRRGRPHAVEPSHAAGQGAGRHDGRRADGAEDARAARAPRRLRRVLPRLLHHPHALPLLAVAAGGGGDAGVGVGAADGPGAGAHAGRPARPAPGRDARAAHRAARRAGDGLAVRAVPAHRPVVGRAAGRRDACGPLELDAHGLGGRGRPGRQRGDAAALPRPRAAAAGDVFSRTGADAVRRTRVAAAATGSSRRSTGHSNARRAAARSLAQALYLHIRRGGYTYTLAPGTYGGISLRSAIDEFWLDRKLGFCEHFASAFVVVMRAMGVPARVVTGYQGTEPLPVDG